MLIGANSAGRRFVDARASYLSDTLFSGTPFAERVSATSGAPLVRRAGTEEDQAPETIEKHEGRWH